MAPRVNVWSVILLAPFVALLAWLSTASTIAAFSALPSRSTIASVEGGHDVSPDEARDAADANMRAAKWFEGSHYRLHAARALLALPAPLHVRERSTIERLTVTSLTAAPMSSYGWTLLAFLRLNRQDLAGAARAWEMSVLVGRYVPDLMQSRLLLGIRMLRYDHDLADSVIDQVRALAEADPRSLAQAARHGGAEATVRAALVDREQVDAFERETKAIVAGAARRVKMRTSSP